MNIAPCLRTVNANTCIEELIEEVTDLDESCLELHPALRDEELQLLYQITSSLCKEALILLALGPTGSGKTITLNRLTAGLVHLDVSKRKSQVDALFRPELQDLFDGRHPTCYVREFGFSSLPPSRMLGIAPLDTPLKLAVIDTPGFTNKIQLNNETIMNGFKSLDSFLTTCKQSLNCPQAQVFVVYFLKQTWTWSKVDSEIIKGIQHYYGSVNMFCITHSLVIPAYIQHPLSEELIDFKNLELPDIHALHEEENSYLGLVSETDKLLAEEKFEKSWVSLYKRLYSLSSHITKIRENVVGARIIFFENSPNLSSTSDLGLANLVFKFSRGLNYTYGSFFTMLTLFDMLPSSTQFMLLPTSMDRSRVSRLPVDKEEQLMSPFHKYDIDCVRKGQMDFFQECRDVIDDINRDKIHRVSKSFFKSSLHSVTDPVPLQQTDSPIKRFVSQDSSKSCSSTLSDTDISSTASETSEGSRKIKMKLTIKALWSDLFESREEGFQFLTEETKNIPQSTQPNKKYSRRGLRDKSDKSDNYTTSRRKSAPLFASLGILNPDLAQFLSKKRSSEGSQSPSLFYTSDSSSNNIRLRKSNSESPITDNRSPISKPQFSKSQSARPRVSSSVSIQPIRIIPLQEDKSPSLPNLPNELEETIVNLIGNERKNCMLCKDELIYSVCPKCKRGYCEACVFTFSGFQKKCKFDSTIMESVSL
ncbi:hypothetical protein LOD99_5083 [Oopsacas minuta]|uniref:G domain-containing protein n=1 Tax=Oopsacas minuta TaxID=111878 RepID=A0AAV7JSS3_9METZ|nr:hypothetical protein LOD99_5083 [Oopsacas minuta]